MFGRACAIAASLIAVGATVGTPTASAAPGYREYVALGDSWAADVSLVNLDASQVPVGCAQSRFNYPKQVAAALGVASFRDATCGSATTVEMTAAQPLYAPGLLGTNAPQFDRLTPSTDLVTLGIGGNDAGLADVVTTCVTFGASHCTDQWVVNGVDRMSAKIQDGQAKVVNVIQGIKARSPQARILVVGYLAGLSTNSACSAESGIPNSDAVWLGRKLVELNDMLIAAAAATGAEYVDTYSGSIGHDACQAPGVRWVEGTVPMSSTPPGVAPPFHPNQLGADHQAWAVKNALGL